MKINTSGAQFAMMVDFMEQNGDLSKPAGGPHGRQWVTKKWQELTCLLNSDPSGAEKSEEKWRKVWSDLKNNTKKKLAKINRSISGTGGGPALTSHLTDVEQRVVAIVGVQAATGLDNVAEAGFVQVQAQSQAVDEIARNTVTKPATPRPDEDWNMPGTSTQSPNWNMPGTSKQSSPPVADFEGLPAHTPRKTWQRTIQKKKVKVSQATQLFLRAERDARELERERLRVRVIELQQRDREIDLHVQWLEFMRYAMNILERWLNERRS